MGKPRFIAGVDIGSTKVCALAAEATPDGQLRILNASSIPAKGIQRGAVVDLEAATNTVGRALNRLALATESKINSVLLGTSATVISLNNRAASPPLAPDRPITVDDVRDAVAASAEAGLPSNRQVVHAIPRRFLVDGQGNVSNPAGLFGRRVDADVHLVTAAKATMQALIAAVERCKVEVEEVVAQPLAAAQAVLTPEERELGVVVADIGAGSCGVSVFVEGSPWHTATIPVGGRHLTQDLAMLLGVTYEVAEELKLSAGHAISGEIDPREKLNLPLVEGDGEGWVWRRQVCEIVEARVVELIGLIGEEIRRSGYAGLLPAGLVLTGGTALLPGIDRVAGELLELRVRIGQPAIGTAAASGPSYASAAGLLLWGLNAPSRRWWTYPAHPPREAAGRAPFATVRWLKAIWPPILGGERSG